MSLSSDPYQKNTPEGVTCCGWGICQRCNTGCRSIIFGHMKDRGVTKCSDQCSCHTGCTGKATIYCARMGKYRWEVCEYCSNRGLYALPETMSDLGQRFYIKTNEPVN